MSFRRQSVYGDATLDMNELEYEIKCPYCKETVERIVHVKEEFNTEDYGRFVKISDTTETYSDDDLRILNQISEAHSLKIQREALEKQIWKAIRSHECKENKNG